MGDWSWEDGSVLYGISPYTPPRDIFLAVCSELGRFYSLCGAKYLRSGRILRWDLDLIRCEMGFWSSHSNIAGKWVNFEIVTSVFALDKSEMQRKGVLSFRIRPENFNVYDIDAKAFFKITEYIDETLELVKTFETRAGIKRFLETRSRSEEDFLSEHPNNPVYYNRLK